MLKKKVVHIDDDIKNLLMNLRIEGNTAYITEQLDRDTYVRLNKALEALGGKWNRSARGHVFPGDPSEKIAEALQAGQAVDIKKSFEFFETPPAVANLMIDRAGIFGDHVSNMHNYVLEPSAGHGAIADVIRAYVPISSIHVIEIEPSNRQVLKEKGYKLVGKDFMKYRKKKPLYDRIVMNPPFSKQQDIDHVLHAWKFLRPRGRLVSVMAGGTEYRQNKKAVAFQKLVEEHGFIEPLPQGSFEESGTGVNTVLVTLDK